MKSKPRHCTATTAAGNPCRAWARTDSDPPRCSNHQTKTNQHKPGAPPGNTNAQTHAAYSNPQPPGVSLELRIQDLDARIQRLSQYLSKLDLDTTTNVDRYISLAALHGQLTSRLGRLLKDQAALTGEDTTELDAAIDQAISLAADLLNLEI